SDLGSITNKRKDRSNIKTSTDFQTKKTSSKVSQINKMIESSRGTLKRERYSEKVDTFLEPSDPLPAVKKPKMTTTFPDHSGENLKRKRYLDEFETSFEQSDSLPTAKKTKVATT